MPTVPVSLPGADTNIAVAPYSSAPIGRLVGQDVPGLVQFYSKPAK
jgi:hypothetical protein